MVFISFEISLLFGCVPLTYNESSLSVKYNEPSLSVKYNEPSLAVVAAPASVVRHKDVGRDDVWVSSYGLPRHDTQGSLHQVWPLSHFLPLPPPLPHLVVTRHIVFKTICVYF